MSCYSESAARATVANSRMEGARVRAEALARGASRPRSPQEWPPHASAEAAPSNPGAQGFCCRRPRRGPSHGRITVDTCS